MGHNQKSLKDLQPGEAGCIVRVKVSEVLGSRLIEMGLVKGSLVLVKKLAPLGDPMEIEVRGYSLSLRKSEAEGILVEPVSREGNDGHFVSG